MGIMQENKQTSNSTKVLKGISSQTIVTIVLGIVEIVSFSIMSRLLSKEDFGFYAAINAIVIVFSSLSETGIGSALIQKKDISYRYVSNAFTLSLLFGIASMAILFLAAMLLPESIVDQKMRLPLMLMSFTLLLNCISSVFMSILHRNLKFISIGIVKLISLVVTTIVAVILAIKGFGYYAIITKAILASVISCFLFFILSKTKYGLIIDKDSFKAIFSFSGWLMASRFFAALSKQVDKLIMPRVMTITELGAYTRPKDFINTISEKINGIFDSALFPVLSSIQDKKEALAKAYRKSLYSMNLFSLLLSLAFAVNSELILRVFFGKEWIYLTPVFIVFSVLVFFNADGRIADCYLRSLGKTKQQFYFRIVEFVTKAIGVIVGSHWGLIGVAIGVTLMECFVKMIKMVYAGSLVSVSFGEIIVTLFKSCRFSIALILICLLVYMLVPSVLWGEIVLLSVFSVSSAIMFICFPNFVGEEYKRDLFPMIKKITDKVFRLNKQ